MTFFYKDNMCVCVCVCERVNAEFSFLTICLKGWFRILDIEPHFQVSLSVIYQWRLETVCKHFHPVVPVAYSSPVLARVNRNY